VAEAPRITSLAGEHRTSFLPCCHPKRAPRQSTRLRFSVKAPLAVGSEVHRALAKISWIDDGLPDFRDLPVDVALL
jgi:hypothetical protein